MSKIISFLNLKNNSTDYTLYFHSISCFKLEFKSSDQVLVAKQHWAWSSLSEKKQVL